MLTTRCPKILGSCINQDTVEEKEQGKKNKYRKQIITRSQLENMEGKKDVNFVRDKQEDKGKESAKRACDRCGKVGHFGRDPECPAKGKTCYKCGGADHFSPQCKTETAKSPKPRREEKRKGRKTKKPDRWRDYNPCGVPIPEERIIVFKTPLSHEYYSESDQDRFTPMDLVNDLEQKDIKLGMVVDFTYTDKYYSSKELSDHGILYCKIRCAGKKIPDDKKVVERFKTEVCTFLKSNSDSVVGVHCTHGLNRSGYVVCRYLIECRGYTHEDAINAFNKARGHEMERENYLEDLHKKIPKCDFTSYVCTGDNRKRDEIPFDRPRHLHTNSRYATRHNAFEEDKTNWRSSNYIRGNTNGNDFRSRYHDQQVDRYQPPTGNIVQRSHYSERRFRSERHREDNHDNYNRHDNYGRTYHHPERDHRSYSERNYNDYGDGYYYSNNFRGYGRDHYDNENYASSSRSGRNREDSSRRDHEMRPTFVRTGPKPCTQHRKNRT